MPELASEDSPDSIARDVAAIQRISAVPALLRVVCEVTGMGFAAVARVTEGTWTACAVQDNIGFGLKPGGQLDLQTTLCTESRSLRQPIVIDHAAEDPVYRGHHTPRIYGIQSYISVPIVLKDGSYFGNLCAIDPRPRVLSAAGTLAMFDAYANLVAAQLESEDRQHAAEIALHDERAKAELREQFVAVLGHDLRNPLAALASMAQALGRHEQRPPDLSELSRRMRLVTRRMSHLIDDVLDFTRARLGSGMGVQMAPIDDLAQALQEVVAEIRESHPEREIVEYFAIAGPVAGDRGRIQQVLSNLLGNAVHHGASDRPIGVRAWTADGQFTLEVSNHGNPIAPAEIGKIFDPYWRSPSSAPGGGLGLGLHICSQIVQAHRGTLTALSSAEDGTRFTVRLPVSAD
jgi:signal transduction histidine kinase